MKNNVLEEKCVFCGEKDDSMTCYRQKPICNNCFGDIFDWSKETALNNRIRKLEKSIEKVIKGFTKD